MAGLHTKRIVNLNTKKTTNYESDFEPFVKLLRAMCNDPVINKKVVNILKLDSYTRHIVLSNWLEQLRKKSASENLRQALSCLFDDHIAKKVLSLINKHGF